MSEENPVLLMSVRGSYASQIVAGVKTVEIRRRRPRALPGDRVVFYASSPVRAIVCLATLVAIVEIPATRVWETWGHACGGTEQEVAAYTDGCSRVQVIRFGELGILPNPLSLERIRSVATGFSPPRSFGYLRHSLERDRRLLALVGGCGDRV